MLNQIGEVEELIVEATNHIEHQRSIPNGLTKIRQLVSDGLEAAEIFGDGEVPLHESVKLGIEDHGAVFLIADKLLLETLPDKACSGKAVSSFGAHLVDLRCDGAVEPRQDSAVEAAPWDVVGVVIFTKDVIRKSVALQCIKEEAAPPIVLGEAEFKGDGLMGTRDLTLRIPMAWTCRVVVATAISATYSATRASSARRVASRQAAPSCSASWPFRL